jgi:methyl-accepting chemotaxis protein
MKWRRKNYLINKDFQLRYIGRIVFSIIVMALVTAFTVYYTTWARIMDQFYNVPQIASQFAMLFSSVNRTMGLFLLVFVAVIAAVSVFISHSIAGPVFRFEKSLQAVAAGDLTLKIGLRKGDEFKHLADTMNEMITSLRTNLTSDRQLIADMSQLLAQISQERTTKGKNTTEAVSHDLEKLNSLIQKLQQDSQRFKLD